MNEFDLDCSGMLGDCSGLDGNYTESGYYGDGSGAGYYGDCSGMCGNYVEISD